MPPPQSAWQGQPPPPRSSHGCLIAVVLVGVVLVGIAAIGLSHAGRSRTTASGGHTTATSTWSSDPTTTTTRPTTTTPRTTASSPTSTSRRTYTSAPSQPPTSTQPAGPQPVVKLGDNPLFEVGGLPATNCKLSRWTTDPAGAEQFFRSALPCLDAAWSPVMQAAGLPFFSPKLAFPKGTSWSSPCGSVTADRAAAFYCDADNTLYMPFEALQTAQYGAHPGVYLALFAHEYGHHVQAMSGISRAYTNARFTNSDGNNDAGWELSRRLELEAQCFSGMFLAASSGRGDVDGNITNEAQTTQDRGDHNGPPRDHGTDAHAEAWWNQGFQRNSLAQCDTWLSSPGDVA